MNYTPQQLAQALVQSVPMYGAPGQSLPPEITPLGQMQAQQPSSGGGSMLDPAALSKMFGGLMGMGGAAGGAGAMGGAYMDAGSMPLYAFA